MRMIDADDFSNEFNSNIFNKLHNEYLNSTADDKTKDVADFVTTDIMTVFNDLIENTQPVEPYCYFCGQKEHGIRPQGKWRVYEGVITCEKCGKETEEMTPFCPWCGADNRGKEE